MAAPSEFFSRFYTMTIVFFNLLLLKVVVLIRCLFPGSTVTNSDKLSRIIAKQYLSLIEEKNPTIPYSEKFRRQQSRECAVCLSEFMEGETVRKLKCNHAFHKECLDKWLQQYLATCPLCRTKVLADEIVAIYHLLQDTIQNGGSYDDTIFLLSALYGNGLKT